MMDKPSLGFIGAGKVGLSLARLWYAAGYDVRAVYSRGAEKASELGESVKAKVAWSADDVVKAADLTLLTVPDDAIEGVAQSLRRDVLNGKGVIHTSGVHDAHVLSVLKASGAMVGSLHPAFPFADVETAAAKLPDVVFAVETENERLRAWLAGMVAGLNGHILTIAAGQKAVYHSALVFASNYTVTLYAIAEQLLTGLGAERDVADLALNGLMAGVVENLRQRGIPEALTGPLVRGDGGTIEAHLRVLEAEGLGRLYRELARQSYPILEARGIETDPIERVLRQGENHAIDDS